MFVLPRRPNSEFIIRANHNRCVKFTQPDPQVQRLQQAMENVAPTGQLTKEKETTSRASTSNRHSHTAGYHFRITTLARYHPDLPADTILETHEWQALYCTIHHHPHPPDSPPNLRDAVRWIAQLGGFLARSHDGEPGVKTIWQGLRRLHDIAQTWLLLSPKITAKVKGIYVKKDVSNA